MVVVYYDKCITFKLLPAPPQVGMGAAFIKILVMLGEKENILQVVER